MMDNKRDSHLYGTIKVGDRGQVVIPAEARKDLDVKPGDLLVVMTGRHKKALTLVKADAMRELADRIMQGLESPKEP